MRYPHLPRAPITEALIDLRVELPAGTQVEHLLKIREFLGSAYPEKKDQIIWHGQIVPTAERAIAQETKQLNGYYFWSADKLNVVQARLDGFACSRLRPYLNWETLREETKTRWRQYVHVANPEKITRVAARTINRIDLPIPVTDFRTYFKTFFNIADGLTQELAGLYIRAVMPRDNAVAILTIAIDDQGATKDAVPLIFDIDVFASVDMAATSDDVWALTEELREIKNQIFFGSLTQATLEMFS